MFGNLSGPTLLVILFIVLLLFGAPKLPALARSLGQSMKILKKEVAPGDADAASKNAEGTGAGEELSAEAATQKVSEGAAAADMSDELAKAKAEAAEARAEAEALRAAAERRSENGA